jgi:hypothetical protein
METLKGTVVAEATGRIFRQSAVRCAVTIFKLNCGSQYRRFTTAADGFGSDGGAAITFSRLRNRRRDA